MLLNLEENYMNRIKNIKLAQDSALKNVIRITFLLLLFHAVSYAQSVDSLFIKANKLYQQESYKDALSLYSEIEKQNFESDALYFNMANAYYKTNQVASCIFYYEKAIKLNPNNKDYRFNLDFAKKMILDNIEVLPKSLGEKFRDIIILKFSYNTWAIIAVSLAFLFALLFLLYHFSYSTSKKRIYFVTSILCVIFVTTSLFFAYRNYQYISSVRTAIIFAQQTEVRSAPSKSGEINFELHEGTKVEILESLDNWVKIKISDGKTGWINVKKLKEI